MCLQSPKSRFPAYRLHEMAGGHHLLIKHAWAVWELQGTKILSCRLLPLHSTSFFPRRRGRVVRGRPCCMNYELKKVHQLPVLSIRRKSGPRGAVSSNPALKDWIARRNQSGRSPGFSVRGWADRNARAKTLQRSDGYSLSLFVFHPPDSSLPMQPPFGREVVRPWIKASSRPSQFATKKEVGLGEWPP